MPPHSGVTLSIGFDDTDSPSGMCTTFLAYKMVASLRDDGAEFLDFPRLVRFNPNVPWKTRGNGAVSMKIRTADASRTKSLATELVRRYSDTGNGANPGLAFLEGEIPDDFARFSELAMWQLVSRRKARDFAAANGLDFLSLGNGQGLVGAIGAIGYRFGDHTFELLSYRRESEFGKQRSISPESVRLLQEKNQDTFGSFDEKRSRILIAPHGPDPVFYGIRGERATSLLHAARLVRSDEKPGGYMIFKSNQGTGDHLKHDLGPGPMRPYHSGMITGIVKDEPESARGGHVFFTVMRGQERFRCAVYRPTGMVPTALALIPGDKICVGGGVRRASKNFPRVLNVEFIRILALQVCQVYSNPVCKSCSKSMKSKGKGQGYMCTRCGSRSPAKIARTVPRSIREQLYLPAVSSHRHLTRPMQRIGRNNTASRFAESIPWMKQYDA